MVKRNYSFLLCMYFQSGIYNPLSQLLILLLMNADVFWQEVLTEHANILVCQVYF